MRKGKAGKNTKAHQHEVLEAKRKIRNLKNNKKKQGSKRVAGKEGVPMERLYY